MLPNDNGGVGYVDESFTRALHRSGALLHVSGHCHWAHGVYQSQLPGDRKRIPCVVASVSDSQWRGSEWRGRPNPPMESVDGNREDGMDLNLGGYNISQPIVVCDLVIPGG